MLECTSSNKYGVDNSIHYFVQSQYYSCVTILNLTLEGPCIIFCNIYTFQRDTQCSSTDCLLMLRCQLYMFWTITVHPQELLFRYCMCRLWYVVRNALSYTSRWYNVWGTLYQRNVSDSAFLTTYHSLHIQHLKRSSWGWTVTVRNM